ncbi:hypothetical protein Aperf_G00000025114 [Anoplocephala perfoliata]
MPLHAHKSPESLSQRISFGQTHKESAFDYGFTQAQVAGKTSFYLAYRELAEAMDRKAPRCFVSMDERCIRLIEKKWPFEEVTIFTRDIVSYYKFDYTSKFVVLCIDAERREKTGYWFISFDTKEQLEDFCNCLNRLFILGEQKNSRWRRQTVQCRSCGASVKIPYYKKRSPECADCGDSEHFESARAASRMPSRLTVNQVRNAPIIRRRFRRI